MAKIRLTKVMKDYIKEELMAPVEEWWLKRRDEIAQKQEEELKTLFPIGDEFADRLIASIEDLGNEVRDEAELKSRLRRNIRDLYHYRRIKFKDDVDLSRLNEVYKEKKAEVNKALVQIELECALGTDKEEFMSLLNDYKEKVTQGL